MSSLLSPKHNHMLAALPEADYLRLLPRLEPIAMSLGAVIYASGNPISHLYFPTDAVISLLYFNDGGASTEIAVVGNEGLVGISLVLGSETTISRAVVQGAGNGYRLEASHLRKEFALGGDFQHLVLRYTLALITQMAQVAVCNRHHTLEQQLCRWLLMNMDRATNDEVAVTQEWIANMLGVRRQGVTEAAGNLQTDGLIHYSRGHIKILDREKLEKRVCECYAVVKKEYNRLLPFADAGGTSTNNNK